IAAGTRHRPQGQREEAAPHKATLADQWRSLRRRRRLALVGCILGGHKCILCWVAAVRQLATATAPRRRCFRGLARIPGAKNHSPPVFGVLLSCVSCVGVSVCASSSRLAAETVAQTAGCCRRRRTPQECWRRSTADARAYPRNRQSARSP